MEIKIDINLNLQNINQIIDKLSYLINKGTYIEPNPSTKAISQSVNDKSDIKTSNNIKSKINKEIHTKLNENKVNENTVDITIDDIRNKISSLSQIGKVSKAKEILSKYNATKVSQINSEHYENLYKELNYELSN
jgi:hypothetical protein